MKTGIVILNYNDCKTTIELLEKIKEYEILNKIVVVDNNSTDNSYEILSKYENEKIKVIKTEENKGYSYGNNIGCKYLIQNGTDYIIISNPDVSFKEDDVLQLCKNLKNTQIAVASPVINEHGVLNRGWKFRSTFIDSLTNINFIGRFFKKLGLYKNKYYNGAYTKVDVVSGCFFVIKAEILEEINYFDENVFLYYEENILAKKIQKLGKLIVVNNDVEVFHNHSISVNKSLKKIEKFKILAKSQRYYHKKYNNANIFRMLELYISYYLTLGISYFLSLFGI